MASRHGMGRSRFAAEAALLQIGGQVFHDDIMGESLMTVVARRPVLLGLLSLSVGFPVACGRGLRSEVEVWKGPNCRCCEDWVRHLESSGFTAKVSDTGNSAIRTVLGLPVQYASCHTARVGGYAIEGHVPAGDIQRLLRERPDAVGLAVPAMPLGSPGMDGVAYQGRRDPFNVLLIKKDGRADVFQAYW